MTAAEVLWPVTCPFMAFFVLSCCGCPLRVGLAHLGMWTAVSPDLQRDQWQQ